MERQLANLTGLVQKALTQNPQLPLVNNSPNILNIPGQYRNGMCNSLGAKQRIPNIFVSYPTIG